MTGVISALSAPATLDLSSGISADGELMAQVAAGDREALALLVDRHKDRLVNYLTRLTGHRDRAEELAQDTFLRLFQSSSRYREEGKFLPYLYRIATNLARSEDRRERRARWFASLPHTEAADPVAETGLLREEGGRALRAALRGLPLAFRVPVVLFAVEGWSQKAIAELLGCREGTVKSRIHRGRERLRRALAPYYLGSEGAG
jgi:RNA polymerase sigma-70 factor (ECF subfamily)